MALPVMINTSCTNQSQTVSADTQEESGNLPIYSEQLGIQVFGVRELLEKEPRAVFQAIANVGIKNIELFDPFTLKNYVPIIRELGMLPLCTHFLPGYITGKWDTVKSIGMTPPDNYHFENILEDCVANGVTNLGIAILMPEERESLDDFKRFADLANTHGELSQKAGVQLYYHNHSFEFEQKEGVLPFEAMLDIFDPSLVKIELDVFWVTIAGHDPLAWINKIGDRLLFLHMKDLKKDTPLDYSVFGVDPSAFLEIGDGIIDFPKVLEVAKAQGVKYAFLDQDHTQMDKLESIQKSYDYLKGLGI